MRVQALESTDGFVLFDLDAATTSVGVVRTAPKVLRDSAELLARSVTYAFATFGVARHAGASAGVNAPADARTEAVTSFLDEVRPLVEQRQLVLWPGTGVQSGELGEAGTAPDAALLAGGAIVAAEAALGTLDGARVACEGSGLMVEGVSELVVSRGASLVDGGASADCDVLFVAGKAGVIDDDVGGKVQARAVVPLTAAPVTAKAFALLFASGVVYVPDFVSTAAPLLAAVDADGDPVERVRARAAELAAAGTRMWLTAAEAAEDFLATWQDEQPFGRPLA